MWSRATAGTNRFPESLVLSLCEGHDGSLWIGADFDGGLTRFKDGRMTHYTWKDGLINAPVRVIHEDRAGALWLGTSRGLCRLQNGKFTRYTTTQQPLRATSSGRFARTMRAGFGSAPTAA